MKYSFRVFPREIRLDLVHVSNVVAGVRCTTGRSVYIETNQWFDGGGDSEIKYNSCDM